MNTNNDITQIQDQINSMINVNTRTMRRKKNDDDIKRELFIDIVTKLELAINRSSLSGVELGINLSEYDELFFQIIDNLIFLSFGTLAGELVSVYCYDRPPVDGFITYTDEKGIEIKIDNVESLWNEVKKLI